MLLCSNVGWILPLPPQFPMGPLAQALMQCCVALHHLVVDPHQQKQGPGPGWPILCTSPRRLVARVLPEVSTPQFSHQTIISSLHFTIHALSLENNAADPSPPPQPALVTVVPKDKLKISGETKSWAGKGSSGKAVHRVFCPTCGSPIAHDPEAAPEIIAIKAGTLDTDIKKTLEPDTEIWTRSKLPFMSEKLAKPFDGMPE